MTPLLHAARTDNELILGDLVENHAVNLNARDNTGQTSLSFAAAKGSYP
jgi:ankyrin repeat protein